MNQEQAHREAAASSRLVVRAALRTDVGRVRAENQDHAAATTAEEEAAAGLAGRLLVVADGMGGHRGGATASRLAAETVKSEYLESGSGDVPRVLREAVVKANDRIWTEAQRNSDVRGMGTTTSALVVRGGEAWLAHVGDSRIYVVRDGEARQLTEDHSLVATLVKEGLLTPEEAENHPRRNVLQRSLGVANDVEVDVTGPIDVRAGDVFILCSDGLHGLVKPAEMVEVARLPLEAAADEFLKRALERGAPDNVTVIVAHVVGDDSAVAVGADRFDDTQPFEHSEVDSSLFDETVVEGRARTRAKAAEQPAPVPESPAVPPPAAPSPVEPVKEDSPAAPADARGSGVARWLLVLLLVASAGAIWFATRDAAPQSPAGTGTTAR